MLMVRASCGRIWVESPNRAQSTRIGVIRQPAAPRQVGNLLLKKELGSTQPATVVGKTQSRVGELMDISPDGKSLAFVISAVWWLRISPAGHKR